MPTPKVLCEVHVLLCGSTCTICHSILLRETGGILTMLEVGPPCRVLSLWLLAPCLLGKICVLSALAVVMHQCPTPYPAHKQSLTSPRPSLRDPHTASQRSP
jgi:hypothetical protein